MFFRPKHRQLPAGGALLLHQNSEDGVPARLGDLRQRHGSDLRHGFIRLQKSLEDIESHREDLRLREEGGGERGHEQGGGGVPVPVLYRALIRESVSKYWYIVVPMILY